MHSRHLPSLGPEFWTALCFASVFGANMGDFFAQGLGLGHLRGLPFLAAALFLIVVLERFDQLTHEGWYWAAVVTIRTAATNLGDLLCGDLRLSRLMVTLILSIILAAIVAVVWNAWRRSGGLDLKRLVLGADANYWLCMLVAGTLGTVLGDYFSHDLNLSNVLASIVLGLPLACCFIVGGRGRILQPALYWITVVLIRSAGTTVGDFFAQRNVLGLSLSTAATGAAFVLLLFIQWARRVRSAP
jgi:uncharacterized membrane-anchored protein